MLNFLNSVSGVIWGIPMLILFIFTSIRLTIHGRFFQFKNLNFIFKETLGKMFKHGKKSGISDFSVFCSVLGACIGTGNIVGVATAIYSGGPGTVFWMILSAVFSMMTAYGENYLGIIYKRKDRYGRLTGGAFSYIANGLNMKTLAKVYAFLSLMSVIGMGNMAQSNSVADSLKNSFDVSPLVTGIIIAVLCTIIVNGGFKLITKLQTVLVPIMTLLFFVLSVMVIIKFKENISACVITILKEAFSLKSIRGFGIYKAAKFGISRGVFSNEAGLGSSTIIHSQSDDSDGINQGLWAMVEVFADTVVMCSVTAIVLLVSTNYNENNLYGAELSAFSYSLIGEFGKKGIGLLTAIFAFSSLSSCCFYGEKSFEYAFNKKTLPVYKCLYVIFSFIGCTRSPELIWSFADICNGLMAIPNLFALNVLIKEIEFPYNRKSKNTRVNTVKS